MIYLGNFKKIPIFHSKAEKYSCLCSHNVLENLVLLYRDFGMNSYSVCSNEVMKPGDEALKASFLRSVKCFIASLLCIFTLHFYSAFDASSPLLF
jgi:hypothetical protein